MDRVGKSHQKMINNVVLSLLCRTNINFEKKEIAEYITVICVTKEKCIRKQNNK